MRMPLSLRTMSLLSKREGQRKRGQVLRTEELRPTQSCQALFYLFQVACMAPAISVFLSQSAWRVSGRGLQHTHPETARFPTDSGSHSKSSYREELLLGLAVQPCRGKDKLRTWLQGMLDCGNPGPSSACLHQEPVREKHLIMQLRQRVTHAGEG